MAVKMFERSAELDSGFAQAYEGLAQAHSRMHYLGFDQNEERLFKAKQALEQGNPSDQTLRIGRQKFGYDARRTSAQLQNRTAFFAAFSADGG